MYISEVVAVLLTSVSTQRKMRKKEPSPFLKPKPARGRILVSMIRIPGILPAGWEGADRGSGIPRSRQKALISTIED
jgi:hypothetical protein